MKRKLLVLRLSRYTVWFCAAGRTAGHSFQRRLRCHVVGCARLVNSRGGLLNVSTSKFYSFQKHVNGQKNVMILESVDLSASQKLSP